MKFKHTLGLGFLAALLATSALAQTVSPSQVVVNAPARFATYSATYVNTTTAASLTDFFVIGGSATKTVYVKRIACSGNTTAAATGILSLIKRSTADTAGTVVTPSASAGGQKVPHDSSDPAATATVVAYTANPTLGTAVGVLSSRALSTAAPAGNGAGLAEWNFSVGDDNTRAVTLRGTAQQLAVGGLGTALAAGAAITCTATWVEQ